MSPEVLQTSLSRHKLPLGVLFIAIILFGALPIGLRAVASWRIGNLDKRLQRAYGVTKSYDGGSTTQCVKRSPENFGDIAGVTACSIITAKIFYPRVSFGSRSETEYDTGTPVKTTYDTIDYVDSGGRSLAGYDGYIMFGTPIKQPGQGNPYYVDAKLGLSGFDHVVFAGISDQAATDGNGEIAGKWDWESASSWLGAGTPGAALQDSISKKILADAPPAPGAPTASAALAHNTAPLVAYFVVRYCHNVPLPVLDNLCVLPN